MSAKNRKALESAISIIESEERLHVLPPHNWHVAKLVLRHFLAANEAPRKAAIAKATNGALEAPSPVAGQGNVPNEKEPSQ